MEIKIPHETNNYKPGGDLRAARCRARLTQAEVARMVGIHQSDVSMIERGQRLPGRPLLQRLKDALTLAEVPIQGGNAAIQSQAFQNIVLRLNRRSTLKYFRRDLYWYVGWRLAWLIYLIGFSAFFQGLEDFILSSDAIRNTRPLPVLDDRSAIQDFYRLIQDKRDAQKAE